MKDFVITCVHPQLVAYIDWLQRKNAESLSFYPLSVFERESRKGRVILGLLNNEPCGYLYFGALKGIVRIHQVCIQFDARRKLYGAQLVGHLEDKAIKSSAQAILLRCGFDLEANEFWQELGYSCIGIADGGVRRMRKINIWQKALQPVLNLPTIEPATGRTNASLWRKNKQVGVITQFARGKQKSDYRKLLVGLDDLP